MQACIEGIRTGSFGPKIGAERRAQVRKFVEGEFADRTRDSARTWWV